MHLASLCHNQMLTKIIGITSSEFFSFVETQLSYIIHIVRCRKRLGTVNEHVNELRLMLLLLVNFAFAYFGIKNFYYDVAIQPFDMANSAKIKALHHASQTKFFLRGPQCSNLCHFFHFLFLLLTNFSCLPGTFLM